MSSEHERTRGDDGRLDEVIDRTVREMMDVDARPGFRGRVMARLQEPQPRRSFWLPLTAAGTLTAAAATVLIMVGGGQREIPGLGPTAPAAIPSGPSVVQAPNPAPGPAPVQVGSSATATRTGGRLSRRNRPAERVTAALATQAPQGIAALNDIDPLVVAPVQSRSIDPAAISIGPLAAIPEVQVEPLSAPSGRRD